MADTAPIVYRDRISIHADDRADGATQPAYTLELARSLFAEVQQATVGKVIRGYAVEAITAFVVSLRVIPNLAVAADCQVTVNTGPFKGQVMWVNSVLVENKHGRPYRWQLHCRSRRKV